MKFCLLIMSLTLISSCGHHHKKTAHHHHKTNEVVPEGDHGEGKYKIVHADKAYYFNSEEERNNFLKNLNDEKENSSQVRKNKSSIK